MGALTVPKPAAAMGGRYSRRVDRLRFVLPTIAALLLALVMAWPWLTGGYSGLIVPVFKNAAEHVGDAMRMANPRYVGKTKAAEAYEVTASSAFLDPADSDRIHLDQLRARFDRSAASSVHLRADQGVYLREEQRLELKRGVELTFGEGYRFETETAEIDLARGHVEGAEPVAGEGPVGRLAAERFQIEDGGERLRFEGKVHVTILPPEPAT
ncbi:MAG: LPS export ABC transporter periplasmic protein LptC [Alphaproteobacteria bacterium]